jgi:hypothetical protein
LYRRCHHNVFFILIIAEHSSHSPRAAGNSKNRVETLSSNTEKVQYSWIAFTKYVRTSFVKSHFEFNENLFCPSAIFFVVVRFFSAPSRKLADLSSDVQREVVCARAIGLASLILAS